MASHYSAQYQKFVNVPREHVKTNEKGGRVRVAYFSVVADGTEEANDLFYLTQIPAGSRLLAGWAVFSDWGSATMDIGTAADVDRYADGLTIGTAGESVFLNTALLNYGEELAADTDVIAKILGATAAAAATLVGHILYVLD